jgi:hypothetical protein
MVDVTWLASTTGKTGAGTLDGDEEIRVIDDPGGTPASKKSTIAAVAIYFASATLTLIGKTLTAPIINVGSDATGDIYYRDVSGAFVRLGVGSNGQVLKLASGVPSWAAESGGGGGGTAGFAYTFDSNTTTAADPGAGDIRFNNATPASITEIAISFTSELAADLETLIKSWDDSTSTTNRGTILVKKASAPEVYVSLKIASAITDGTTYGRFTVEHVGSDGTLTDADDIAVEFLRTGDKGDSGAGTGDLLAANNLSDVASAATARGNLGLTIGSAVQAFSAVLAATTASFTTTLETKLNGIETSADVTDATNVTAAGALMDSEVNSLSGVKTLTIPDSTVVSAFAKTVLDDADAAAVRTTIGAPATSHNHAAADITSGTFLHERGGLEADVSAADGFPEISSGVTTIRQKATAAHYRANTADKVLTTDKAWSAMAEVTLTDAATVAVDLATGLDFTVTLASNRTLGNPSNVTAGKRGRIRVVQDATGSRTLSFAANYKFAGASPPVLTTTANAEDYLYYDCVSATKIVVTSLKGVA